MYKMNCRNTSGLMWGSLISVGLPGEDGNTVEPGIRQISDRLTEIER